MKYRHINSLIKEFQTKKNMLENSRRELVKDGYSIDGFKKVMDIDAELDVVNKVISDLKKQQTHFNASVFLVVVLGICALRRKK